MKKVIFAILLTMMPALVFADDATTTPDVATSTDVVMITIRDGSITAFSGTTTLPEASSTDVFIAPTGSTSTIAVPARSLLAVLTALDATSTDFNITDLAYFSSFDSFIINCIAISAASTTDCFNWTYAVNSVFPQIGIDHFVLNNGDIVYLFFGLPRQTTLSTTTTIVGESFTATAQRYDLETGTYVGAASVTLGVGTPNPDFSFTELATSTTDSNGQVVFALNATGTYQVGIKEDFYFPTASITVVEAATSTSTPPEMSPPSSGGGGGGGGGISHSQVNVASALSYLVSKQKADGFFDSSLLTDWAALAFAASDASAATTALRNYLLTAAPSTSNVTDYERHAMALMALGIDPYSGTPTDYIALITAAFDGIQIGDVHLDNDDIFALFPLLHAGYSSSDDIVQKIVTFIVSRQQASGAWDGSVDMTAAAIQALSQVASLPDVSAALTKAESYLHAQQQQNGGWSNSFSTSWALQAISALGQSPSSSNWAPSGYTPRDYLAGYQQSDGGLESLSSDPQTRQWATEYAIVGSLGKTWTFLLSSFTKHTTTSSGAGIVLGASTSTSATSTLPTATSTPSVATSTPPTATSTVEVMVATSTPTTTLPTLPKPKKTSAKKEASAFAPVVVPDTPTIEPTVQAAAATTPNEGFFSKLWHAIISFFANLF